MANTAIINQSGINFTVDNRVNQYTGWERKYSHAINFVGSSIYPNPDVADETTGIGAFGINAVEIDWNGATWSSIPGTTVPTTINTTADLLKAIKYASVQQKPVTESADIHGTFCTKPRLGLTTVWLGLPSLCNLQEANRY